MFGETFLDLAGKTPDSRFIVSGNNEFTFAESLKIIREIHPDTAKQVSLTDNSINSVFSWLALEISRAQDHRDAPVDFIQSSGSTGHPKTFYVSLESQVVTANAINHSILREENSVELIILPLSHSSARGRLRAAILRGAPIFIASHPFTFSSIDMRSLAKNPFSMAITPPTFRYLKSRLGNRFWHFFSGLQNLEFGSASLGEREQAQLLSEAPDKLEIFMHYGLSEASRSFVRNVRQTEWNNLGNPMPHTKYRINDKGELMISGPHIASSQIQSDKKIELTEISTGDLCELSENGELNLIGRLKNTINCGGFTLYTEQLESALSQDPRLDDIVIGKSQDPLLGEIPVLFAKPGSRYAALEAWRKLGAASKAIANPAVCETLDLPMLSSGKIDRQSLNQLASEFLKAPPKVNDD